MLVKTAAAVEEPMTQVAFPRLAIIVVRPVRDRILGVAVPLEQVVGEYTTRVPATKSPEDCLAIQVGCSRT